MSKPKTIIRGYKFRIYPTEEQAKKLDSYIELHRAIYNWAIEQEQKIYEDYKEGKSEYNFYSFNNLCSLFTKTKKNPGNEWMLQIPDHTARTALRSVTDGYKRFFRGQNKGKPGFKKKGRCKDSFGTRNNRIKIHNTGIKIEGMQDSYIDLKFDCGMFLNKVINPVISKDNLGDYYASFSIEEEVHNLNTPKTEGIGIDLGCKQTFALSTGEIYNQPKEKLEKLNKRISELDKQITRDNNRRREEAERTRTKYEDVPKSKRQLKREYKRAKLYKKQHNIKDYFYHTTTKDVVMRNPEFVSMETFMVSKIRQDNKYTSSELSKVSFYDITQKMKHKCDANGVPFGQAPRDFASTQTCNNCGYKYDLRNKRTYKCPNCGMEMDRDINAAINLRNYYIQYLM